MVDLDTREWLLTNGLGSFASGTVSDVRTRTYHGWLFAATNPPSGRTLLLSHLEASLELPKQLIALGTNFWGFGQIDPTGYELLRYFDINPVPKWIWGEDNWQLSRQIIMPYGLEGAEASDVVDKFSTSLYARASVSSCLSHRLLIQYRYEGNDAAILKLRLLISDRDFHNQQKSIPDLHFSQLLGQKQVCLQAIDSGHFGTPWHLRWTHGRYQPDAVWYWNYHLPEETRRGLSDREDLYSPGYLAVTLRPGDVVTLEAKVGFPDRFQSILTDESFAEAIEIEQERLCQIFGQQGMGDKQQDKGRGKMGEMEKQFLPKLPTLPTLPNPQYPIPNTQSPILQQLLRAADQFIVYRTSIGSPTVISGYHWFNDIGRDTLISLPGLVLVPQRFNLARDILRSLGLHCRHGLIPNTLPDADSEPFYNSIDAALWWIETLGLYLEATQDWQFLTELYPVVQQIYKAFIGGTRYNIQVDSLDGLVGWDARGVALTWMDAIVDGQPVTPRRGKPVEINALWYSALCWASRWAEILSEQEAIPEPSRLAKQARRYSQHAQQVKESLQKFWNSQLGYLYDTIEPDDRRNSQVRPNAVIALSLVHCAFSEQQGRQILDKATDRLLTPYGLRTLDPTDSEYIGKYAGNSEKRDRSYHQGTIWGWLIGPYIRAWQRFYPSEPLPFSWQPLLEHLCDDACLGSISEIFDGDYPHIPRGAIAQAKSVAEVIRHFQG
ncbi:amylo-alpha-1,6-glucosidase [Chlorogloeopsis sp. ULAP01]|uniref:amylo-alpha-1,6-glucosidase n=1 Tax=Chlorogloeopsis sp. ULAP01 TaxID=3056483 RepID=UPI0025AB02A0|nr:amylo-alpha-1,6-glucosidase [Chlorogloeopsis sp. ULAP01]MDM9379577.1 amylo-alpha-1,6-glucosidase [Chlorogloeopsis sp. ULAP01]